MALATWVPNTEAISACVTSSEWVWHTSPFEGPDEALHSAHFDPYAHCVGKD